MPKTTPLARRKFLKGAGLAGLTFAARPGALDAAAPAASKRKICAFIKFIQELPYKQLAETVAELGFDGIEATVRKGGHVLPERVEDDLPKLVEALKGVGLEITVMASSVNSLAQPDTRKVLKTAAALGVKRYRLAYYRYDTKRPILEQLNALKPVLRDLTAFHRELGLQGVYQNHAGASSVGAPVWDLQRLMEGYPACDLAIAFDIRHATVEGGLAWPLHFQVAQPHLGAIYVKDFNWDKDRKPVNVPLGTGQVNPRFFSLLRQSSFSGPISLHVEYLPKGGVAANIAALKNDLATLRRLLVS
ncbi:MAG: sugar phosphate isomerase/epimerase family protein [Pirellulaceae bacterium]